MIQSLLRRLILAVFLLGIISVLAFSLSKMVPGDEVLDYLSIDDSRFSSSTDPLQQRLAYARVSKKRKLALPRFYVSLQPGYYPDSLFQIVPESDRKSVITWIKETRNQTASMQFYADLISGLQYTCPLANQSTLADLLCYTIDTLLRGNDLYQIHQQIIALHTTLIRSPSADPAFSNIVSRLNADVDELISTKKRLSASEWLPVLQWHGTGNQYHQWMSGMLTFEPLTSLVDGRNAWSKILGALGWTLWLNGLAFILAILSGIAIGIWSGTHDGHMIERIINVFLFGLFALPSFWLATLFIIFLSSGEWLSIFPTGGLGAYHNANHVFEKWGILLYHLALPVLCMALGSIAYVSRQMKQSVVFQLHQPYVMALRTQGISEKTIIRKHVIKNAFFPLITLIGGSLPALLSGSLIIEVIFSIPGMGRLMYTSLLARDWPVVFPILMFGAAITVIAYILTDVVYKWADPRVKSMGS